MLRRQSSLDTTDQSMKRHSRPEVKIERGVLSLFRRGFRTNDGREMCEHNALYSDAFPHQYLADAIRDLVRRNDRYSLLKARVLIERGEAIILVTRSQYHLMITVESAPFDNLTGATRAPDWHDTMMSFVCVGFVSNPEMRVHILDILIQEMAWHPVALWLRHGKQKES